MARYLRTLPYSGISRRMLVMILLFSTLVTLMIFGGEGIATALLTLVYR